MANQKVVPAFGKPLQSADWYAQIDGIIEVLRPYSTLRTIAQHLHNAGFTTPGGLQWHRMHVANYIRSRGLSKNPINN